MFYNAYKSVMDSRYNPLANIQDVTTRHLVMQILAWMWCIVFSVYVGSIWVFGVTAIAHLLIIAAIVITVSTFEVAKRKPDSFVKKQV